MKIGVLSDTHGVLHHNVFPFFEHCDEIWHAGDIGSMEVLDQLSEIALVRAVSGNIDSFPVISHTEPALVFNCEEHKVAMMHIGGYPGKYSHEALTTIRSEKPTIFVAGHSHILKVMHDKVNNLLFINPGAAGRYGIHTRITFLRFTIEGLKISNLEVYDEPR